MAYINGNEVLFSANLSTVQNNVDVVQGTGDSAEAVMSQKAVTAELGKIGAKVANLESVARGVAFEFETDDSVGYQKFVPSKAAPYAMLDRVGSASVRKLVGDTWELTENKPTALRVMGKNLLAFPYQSGNLTDGDVTFTQNDDGSISINGTASKQLYYILARNQAVNLPKGKYTFSLWTANTATTARINMYSATGTPFYASRTESGASVANCTEDIVRLETQILIKSGTVFSNDVYRLQLERGETATEYEKPSKVISTTALPNLDDLDGWGQGVPSVGGNYITFTDDGRVLYQRTTYRYTFTGQEAWYTDQLSSGGAYFYARFADKPITFAEGEQETAICSAYDAVYSIWSYPTENCFSIYANSAGGATAYFNDLAYSNATLDEWIAYVKARAESGNPIVIEYALAELPAPIDVTARFTGNGIIAVEPNGYIVADNASGEALPSAVTYQVSLREA